MNASLWLSSSLALVLLATPAWAVDLDTLVEAWTLTVDGPGGSEGHDEAHSVAIATTGDILVAGFQDGPPDSENDGYLVRYAPDGTVQFEEVQDSGPIGAERTSSDDALLSVTLEPLTDAIGTCGRRGAATLADADTRYLVESRPAWLKGGAPAVSWDLEYTDGSSSPFQECRGMAWAGTFVYATGWADHGADEGRWSTWKMDEAAGLAVISPVFYDYTQWEAVPDQAEDMAIDTVSGEFVVVGSRGFSGLPGSDLNDSDWHVRHYDATGGLLWEDTLQGAALLEDRATAVRFDLLTGDVYVAGWFNKGNNNAAQRNLDWQVVRYDGDGDGIGGPVRVWTHTFESAVFADEGATAIALDDFGDPLVGGWSIDPVTGQERWRLVRLAAYDGVQIDEWLGPVQPGDARIEAVDFRGGVVAIAGWIDNGANRDFATTSLDSDGDLDGVADSVDTCPDDPDKSIDTGVCGCNVPDLDTDKDGVENCLDNCPTDPSKTEPGVCLCGTPDDDTDGDLTFDCDDDCPTDPDKVEWGVCGCDAPDTDSDGDGVLGCDDACANTPPGTDVDDFGCPIVEETTEPTEAPPEEEKGGCGCDSTRPGATLSLLVLAALAARRRRPGA